MRETAKYEIHGYCRGTDPSQGYDEESTADTMKEARERAKTMMTEAHTRYVEATVPIVYVCIRKHDRDEIIAEFGQAEDEAAMESGI